MPRPRHQRRPSQVLPPDLISGEDPPQILDFGRPLSGEVSGQPRQAPEAGATAAAAATLQGSKTAAGQEVASAGHFPQLPKTPPSTT